MARHFKGVLALLALVWLLVGAGATGEKSGTLAQAREENSSSTAHHSYSHAATHSATHLEEPKRTLDADRQDGYVDMDLTMLAGSQFVAAAALTWQWRDHAWRYCGNGGWEWFSWDFEAT